MTVVAEPEQSDNAVIAVPRRSDRNQNPPRNLATGAARGWLGNGQQLWRGTCRAGSGRAAPRGLGRCLPTRHTARQRAQAAGQPTTCAPHTEMPDLRTTDVFQDPTPALRKTHAHRACWKFRMRWCATLMPACAKDSAENFRSVPSTVCVASFDHSYHARDRANVDEVGSGAGSRNGA